MSRTCNFYNKNKPNKDDFFQDSQYQNYKRKIAITMLASSTIFFALSYPTECKLALLDGYETCVSNLLFALFPFLIAANLLILCNVAATLGAPLKSLCKLLGFREACVSGLFAIALLGGFAPAVSALAQSVKTEQLSAKKASQLLPLLCFLGPSYIIIAVGEGMLGNIYAGVYLYLSQVIASVIVVCLVQIFYYFTDKRNSIKLKVAEELVDTPSYKPAQEQVFSLSTVIGDSFFSFLRLCGVILFFRFYAAGIGCLLPAQYIWISEIILEVTTACSHIALLGQAATMRCCAALSILSCSILFQISALCPKEVSCSVLFCTRILHLPISLFIFRLFLFIPQTQSVYNSMHARVIAVPKLPLDQAILLFVALVFLVERIQTSLQKHSFSLY